VSRLEGGGREPVKELARHPCGHTEENHEESQLG